MHENEGEVDFRFFLYCTACQHPVQKVSNQRHDMPVSTSMDTLRMDSSNAKFVNLVPNNHISSIILHPGEHTTITLEKMLSSLYLYQYMSRCYLNKWQEINHYYTTRVRGRPRCCPLIPPLSLSSLGTNTTGSGQGVKLHCLPHQSLKNKFY